jgi:hypothetical protein
MRLTRKTVVPRQENAQFSVGVACHAHRLKVSLDANTVNAARPVYAARYYYIFRHTKKYVRSRLKRLRSVHSLLLNRLETVQKKTSNKTI